MKVAGTNHQDDARLACDIFVERWPNLRSDIPPEDSDVDRALNHAVSAAIVAGLLIDAGELGIPAVVLGGPRKADKAIEVRLGASAV
jgi:hypothetical protein